MAATPATGPTQTRPMEASADKSANCVAVNRMSHRAMSRATKAAVPMPPARFSSRDHQGHAGQTGWVNREPPEAQVGDGLSHAEDQQRSPQAESCEQPAASEPAHEGGQKAHAFVHGAHLGRTKAHATNQECRGEAAGEGIAELVENDAGQKPPGAAA